eukprot:scaffold53048_cov60-Phaeocystis_antarctica.AAC.3
MQRYASSKHIYPITSNSKVFISNSATAPRFQKRSQAERTILNGQSSAAAARNPPLSLRSVPTRTRSPPGLRLSWSHRSSST